MIGIGRTVLAVQVMVQQRGRLDCRAVVWSSMAAGRQKLVHYVEGVVSGLAADL